MTTSRTADTISRRTALAGLGAGGLGLALATTTRPVSAQDAAADTASHPIVGMWKWNNNPDDPNASTSYAVFHADGSYVEFDPALLVGLGTWNATGERTLDLYIVFQDNDLDANKVEPGMAEFWISIDLEDTGNAMTASGELRAVDRTGNVIVHLSYDGRGQRITAEAPDWVGTPMIMPGSPPSTPTDATPAASPGTTPAA